MDPIERALLIEVARILYARGTPEEQRKIDALLGKQHGPDDDQWSRFRLWRDVTDG